MAAFSMPIGDPKILREIQSLVHGKDFTLMVGFPCQPYSQQGHQGGEHDARSSTLAEAMEGAMLLRPQAMILECVPEASRNAYVQEQVAWICHQMGWTKQDLILDLADVWPMTRKRWWCLLMPPAWHQVDLRPWEKCEPAIRIRDVLCGWGQWPELQERQLQLTVEEMTKYLDPQFGSDRRLIELHDICPPTLHSYSVALSACPCSCRTTPFSDQTLRRRGLRGFCVHSTHTNQPRFLHPLEHAVLLGVPPSMDFSTDLREANCLLGLVASPIQCIWIYSHLIQGASKAISTQAFIQPTKVLAAYNNKQEIIRQARLIVNDVPDQPVLFCIETNEGNMLRLFGPMDATIANLVEAERISLGWGDFARVQEGGLLLPGELPLHQAIRAPINMEHRTKRQRTLAPSGRLVVGIVHGDDLLLETVEAGDFMFQALHKLQLFDVHWLIDEDGKIYGSDIRIWGSMRLYTMDLMDFPQLRPLLRPTSIRAAGPSPRSTGLSGDPWPLTLQFRRSLLSFDHGGLRMANLFLADVLTCRSGGKVRMDRFSGQLLMKHTGFFSVGNSPLMDFFGLYSMDFDMSAPRRFDVLWNSFPASWEISLCP